MPRKELKAIPRFETEDEEREFWSEHDSPDYVDWKRAQRAKLPDLKPTTRTVSIRLPETMLEDLRMLANKRDVPYQSLLKIYVAERIEKELRSNKTAEDAA
jgi:predicted DNA binding CopG/RHH family protein